MDGGSLTRENETTRLTYEDLQDLPDDGQRHELIDGEHYVTPSPNTRHQVIVGNLHYHIRAFLESRPLGRIYLAPFDVVLTPSDVVEPDLLYVAAPRGEIVTKKNVEGAPDLVVEVLSEGTRRRDELIKRKLYEARGVQEYWVVDPELEVVKVYRREGGRFVRVAEASREAGDRLDTPLLPGLTLALEAVFA